LASRKSGRATELFDQGNLVAGVQMTCTLLSLLSG
jgi:hypothetical protein